MKESSASATSAQSPASSSATSKDESKITDVLNEEEVQEIWKELGIKFAKEKTEESTAAKTEQKTISPQDIVENYFEAAPMDWELVDSVKSDKDERAKGYNFGLFTLACYTALANGYTQKNSRVLDVGAGSGSMVYQLLKCTTALVDANDLSDVNLARIKKEAEALGQSARVTPIPGDILNATLKENYYDQIIVRNVMHFMTGDEIEKFLAQALVALKPGGTIVIVANSIYHNLVKISGAYEQIMEKMKNNEAWPGYIVAFNELLEKAVPGYGKVVQKNMHVLDASTMKAQLEGKGYTITSSNYTTWPVKRIENRDAVKVLNVCINNNCEVLNIVATKPYS